MRLSKIMIFNNYQRIAIYTEKLLKSTFISKLPISRSYKKIIAFTLAEILIVLFIIGIVASLTVPGLIQNLQNAEMKVAWKKSYADLEQATGRILIDYQTLKNICFDNNCLRDIYLKYMSSAKACGDDSSNGNCWHKYNEVKTLSGYVESGWEDTEGMILNNGALVRILYDTSTCDNVAWWGIPACGYISVDVNGFRGPNTYGKDIFFIYLFKDEIKPFGFEGDDYPPESDCTDGGEGLGCSALYLMQ